MSSWRTTLHATLNPDVRDTGTSLKARASWVPLGSPHEPWEQKTVMQEAGVQILTLLVTCCVTLSKSLNLSGPSFSKNRV